MQTTARLFTPVLIGWSVIIRGNFAIRASYGLFQIPVAAEFGWPRSDFSLAIAVQNLAWGFGQPVFGAIAERFGDRRAVVGVIFAGVGRAASAANRSVALDIVAAAGSAGQGIGAPIAAGLMTIFPWQTVFVIFAAAILAVLMALPLMRAPAWTGRAEPEESMIVVVKRALRDPSFSLIFIGFFPAAINWPSSPRISPPLSRKPAARLILPGFWPGLASAARRRWGRLPYR